MEDVEGTEARSTQEPARGKSRLLQGVLVGAAAGAVAILLWSSRALFERPNMEAFQVTPDGDRFLVLENNTESMPTQIEVVLNWFDELERLAPTP